MAIAYTIVAIILPALLLATIIYVWWKNRQAGPGAVRKADRATRELQQEDETGGRARDSRREAEVSR